MTLLQSFQNWEKKLKESILTSPTAKQEQNNLRIIWVNAQKRKTTSTTNIILLKKSCKLCVGKRRSMLVSNRLFLCKTSMQDKRSMILKASCKLKNAMLMRWSYTMRSSWIIWQKARNIAIMRSNNWSGVLKRLANSRKKPTADLNKQTSKFCTSMKTFSLVLKKLKGLKTTTKIYTMLQLVFARTLQSWSRRNVP